jgi:hypothetical protein
MILLKEVTISDEIFDRPGTFFCQKLYIYSTSVYDVIYGEPFYLLSALKLSSTVLAASVLVKAWVD